MRNKKKTYTCFRQDAKTCHNIFLKKVVQTVDGYMLDLYRNSQDYKYFKISRFSVSQMRLQ